MPNIWRSRGMKFGWAPLAMTARDTRNKKNGVRREQLKMYITANCRLTVSKTGISKQQLGPSYIGKSLTYLIRPSRKSVGWVILTGQTKLCPEYLQSTG
ncbi:hypothetical protein SKAU_G00387720 [Synaphobranchus kaupii]|uniref:Uncharacterized protein n=1 Tax=Synaphobranchus kaupii TaxID=118154 RepID=A0A9Q1ICG7_SYNKA|nr:hypothetical protein SKAU_G00387720 [Synaphobranchus kaupii]